MGTAMAHVRNMQKKIRKATRSEPNELVVRLRASSGDGEELRETVNENARKLRAAGLAAHGRTARNADHSLDGEIRINIYDPDDIEDASDRESVEGEFLKTLLAFGDETDWPKEI